MAQALAADLTPIRAVRVSALLRALAGAPPLPPADMPQSPASTPPPPAWSPLPPDDHSPVACLHCGTLLPRAGLPACPLCDHSGFLLLQRIPSLTLPPELLQLLPSLPSCAPAIPPAAILASLPVIADWLEQFPPSIHPTAFRVTPPLHVGDYWTSFWSHDYTADWTTTPPAHIPPPLYYWRHPSAGGPWAIGPDLPGMPTVISAPCPTCGRPSPHDASVELPTAPPLTRPRLFCVHPQRHAPFCTRALAPRCTLTYHGLHLAGAVPVYALPWSTLCAPHLPQLLLPPPPYLRALPPPAPSEAALVQPTALTFMTHNLGGHRTSNRPCAPLGRRAQPRHPLLARTVGRQRRPSSRAPRI